MIVLDTSAVIAILQSETEETLFAECIIAAGNPVMGAPTKFELLMVASRHPGGQTDVLSLLDEFACTVTNWTNDQANLAAAAFLRFGKGRHPAGLNFGDCMAYATAKSLDAPLLYKGGDFARTDIRSAL